MTNEDKIKKWLAGELSDAEKKEFESTEEFTEIDKLTKALSKFKAPEYDIDSEFQKLSKTVIHNKKSGYFIKKISPVVKIAAIFIITLTIGYFSYTYLSSNNQEWIAEQTNLYLPDSSFVSLNKDSKVRFPGKKWEKERNVELKGEAFFNVKKGSKFSVVTQQGEVSVLGTEFSVKDWDNYYEVTCYSGLVKVATALNTVRLKPNTSFRIINEKDETYTVPAKSQPDWLNGESSFKSVPFSLVIDELERQYKVSVETVNIDTHQLFTGSFSNKNLEIALKAITIPVNSRYKINGNQIVISFEGN
jgi:transmembrane sensor